MIHVIQTLDGKEYKLHDAKFDKVTELWMGEVVGKGVEIGISSRMVYVVCFFKDAAAYDTYQREHSLSKTRPGAGLIH